MTVGSELRAAAAALAAARSSRPTDAERAFERQLLLAAAARDLDREERNRRGWQAVLSARPAAAGPSLATSLPVGGDRW